MAPDNANVDHSHETNDGELQTTNEDEAQGIDVEEQEEEEDGKPEALKEEGNNLEAKFEEIYQKVLNDPDADPTLRKNLTVFMDDIQNARNAEEKVNAAYIATEKLLENSKTAILEAALPLYEHLTAHMEKAEAAILANFSESHNLRKTIMAKMEEFNKSWHESFEQLKKRLVSTEAATVTPGLSVIAEEEADERNQSKENDEEVSDNIANDEVSHDLDWDEITLWAPGLKETIENFLACREKWSNAVDRFGKALDTAEEKLSKRQLHMLEILANAHQIIFDNLAESKENLMTLFVENHIKREALEEHVALKEAQHSKFFKRLFQSVKGTTNAKHGNDEPAVQKSKKMSSIRKVFKRSKGKKRPAGTQDVADEE